MRATPSWPDVVFDAAKPIGVDAGCTTAHSGSVFAPYPRRNQSDVRPVPH